MYVFLSLFYTSINDAFEFYFFARALASGTHTHMCCYSCFMQHLPAGHIYTQAQAFMMDDKIYSRCP